MMKLKVVRTNTIPWKFRSRVDQFKRKYRRQSPDQDPDLTSPPVDPDPQPQEPLQAQEEDSQEDSGEEMDMELPKNARTTKAGRKTNKTRREKATNQDKELGTQPTLEEILKKEGKMGKLKQQRDNLSPRRGGQQNTIVNNEGSLLELQRTGSEGKKRSHGKANSSRKAPYPPNPGDKIAGS
jgi:hypothetical protein